MWAGLLSTEKAKFQSDETFRTVEVNILGSCYGETLRTLRCPRTHARIYVFHRDLGDLYSVLVICLLGPQWERSKPKPLMHGIKKSDGVIVPQR